MTNRQLVSKQIDYLATGDSTRASLMHIYSGSPKEAETIRIELSDDNTVMIGVGWNTIFSPQQIPLIWKHLKDTGQVDQWRHRYMSKQIKTLDSLRKAIKSVEDGGNKILEQLQYGDKSNVSTQDRTEDEDRSASVDGRLEVHSASTPLGDEAIRDLQGG